MRARADRHALSIASRGGMSHGRIARAGCRRIGLTEKEPAILKAMQGRSKEFHDSGAL
jgi:hypothetical protein